MQVNKVGFDEWFQTFLEEYPQKIFLTPIGKKLIQTILNKSIS
ncbi:hypothetical protein ES705_18045 [subsurface metagenome]